MKKLWSIDDEKYFLSQVMNIMPIEKLMVNIDDNYSVFAPSSYKGNVNTPQARNAFIGNYTEKWCCNFFADIANEFGLHAISGVQCEELGLTKNSPADLAFCRKLGSVQSASDIVILFEIKMGIVNNYLYDELNKSFKYYGDYSKHKGSPSLLRSDSMLKAIGKSVNVRMSGIYGKKVPIIILGNSPIGSSYVKKVDNLTSGGIIQQFISLYPDCPIGIKESPMKGFMTYEKYEDIARFIASLITDEQYFFSSMLSYRDIGKFLEIANEENTLELKGQRFLELIYGK